MHSGRTLEHHAAAVGRQCITPGQDAAGVGGLDPGSEQFHPRGHRVQLVHEGQAQTGHIARNALIIRHIGVQELVRKGGGRLDGTESDPVRDMVVLVVADRREDRDVAVRDVEAQSVIVEARQVEGGPAAAQDQDGVIRLVRGNDRVDGI